MMKLSRFIKPTLLLCVLMLPFNNSAVFAVGSGGFENATFSARSLGQAGATVAQADEVAAVSYNPAGLVQLDGLQAQTSVGMVSSFTFYDSETQGSTRSTGTISAFPLGYFSVNPGDTLGGRVALGVGADTPFGLSKKYRSDHPIARYTGYDTWLNMYSVKPAISIKAHEKLLLGAGPVYYRIFDFGGVQRYPNALIAGGLADGQVRLDEFKGNAWGWQLGALFKPHPKHQFGYYFRSPVTVKTSGLIKVEKAFIGGNFETGGKAKIDLPLNMTWAYAYKPSKKTTLEVDFGFTRWSAHKRLFIDAAPVNSTDDAVLAAIGKSNKDWRNSFSLHLGGNRKINDKLTVLGGWYWMTAPVPKTHFLPSVPDSNRMAVSVGIEYDISRYLSLGITHMSIFNFKRNVNNSISETLGTSVDGDYSGYTQDVVFSISYSWDDVFKKDEAKINEAIKPSAMVTP